MGVPVAIIRVETDLCHDSLQCVGNVVHRAAQHAGAQRFGDDPAHPHARVQAGPGILEDHRHLGAQRAQIGMRGEDRRAGEEDVPLVGATQPVQHLEQGRLSRSGLTDDAETLAAGNGEVDVVQGLDGVGTGAESQVEIPRLDDRGVHGGAHRSSKTIGWPGSTASSRAARSRRRV